MGMTAMAYFTQVPISASLPMYAAIEPSTAIADAILKTNATALPKLSCIRKLHGIVKMGGVGSLFLTQYLDRIRAGSTPGRDRACKYG